MTVDSAYTNRLSSLKFVSDTLSVSELIGRARVSAGERRSNLVHRSSTKTRFTHNRHDFQGPLHFPLLLPLHSHALDIGRKNWR